ncbi:MAG TPA: hypothetical protein VK491_03560 [Gemmatimonadaceae bacterium]|nr:hypothetical protein [Gemmatimonadaceae bacterium]
MLDFSLLVIGGGKFLRALLNAIFQFIAACLQGRIAVLYLQQHFIKGGHQYGKFAAAGGRRSAD